MAHRYPLVSLQRHIEYGEVQGFLVSKTLGSFRTPSSSSVYESRCWWKFSRTLVVPPFYLVPPPVKVPVRTQEGVLGQVSHVTVFTQSCGVVPEIRTSSVLIPVCGPPSSPGPGHSLGSVDLCTELAVNVDG